MATIRDVARAAGVSYQTVSRTLNAPNTVLAATRQRVENAIQAVGYYPNAAARRLKLGRSRLLGVVTTDLLGFGPTHTVQAFMDAAETDGWTVLLVRHDPELNWSEISAGGTSSLNALFEYDVQLVAMVGGTADVAAAIKRAAPQLPLLNIGAPLPGHPSVGIDQERAISALVTHLVELGHHRIAHLAGPARSPDAAAREQGWRSVIRAHGLDELPVIRGDWSASGAAVALENYLDDVMSFSALVCANDQMALGAISALRHTGLETPRDISVTGFDDIDEAATCYPPLTTARQPFDILGLEVLRAARTLLEGDDVGGPRLLAAPLVHRSSVSAPRNPVRTRADL